MKCKCGHPMKDLGTNVEGFLRWCPKCGRVHIKPHPRRLPNPSPEVWLEPMNVEEKP